MYGGLFRTILLGYPVAISIDSQVNNFILQNNGSLFVPQYPTTFSQLFGKWSVLKARGDYHKRARGAVLRFIGSSVLKRGALSDIQNIITSTLSGWEGRTVNVSHQADEVKLDVQVYHEFSMLNCLVLLTHFGCR